ncbi:hypothetical protein CR513_49006, partial [Mucuna pruriens]
MCYLKKKNDTCSLIRSLKDWRLSGTLTPILLDAKIANARLEELSLGNSYGPFDNGCRVVDGIERPLKIYCDNNLGVLYSNNNMNSTKLKLIDIKFLISIEHIGTSFMLVDTLTKGLIPKLFHEHTTHMSILLHSPTNVYRSRLGKCEMAGPTLPQAYANQLVASEGSNPKIAILQTNKDVKATFHRDDQNQECSPPH